jgi:hypothetical protein
MQRQLLCALPTLRLSQSSGVTAIDLPQLLACCNQTLTR